MSGNLRLLTQTIEAPKKRNMTVKRHTKKKKKRAIVSKLEIMLFEEWFLVIGSGIAEKNTYVCLK